MLPLPWLPGVLLSLKQTHEDSPEISYLSAATAAKLLQSCPTLCNPTDGSPPGSSVPGILQARTQEWVAISFSSACTHAKLLQSCPTLCHPMDSSPPGSSLHRILQARVLEWVAISFSLYPSSSTFSTSSHLLRTSLLAAGACLGSSHIHLCLGRF